MAFFGRNMPPSFSVGGWQVEESNRSLPLYVRSIFGREYKTRLGSDMKMKRTLLSRRDFYRVEPSERETRVGTRVRTNTYSHHTRISGLALPHETSSHIYLHAIGDMFNVRHCL